MSAVAVTGLGAVTAAGRGVAAAIGAVLEGRSGLGTLRRFESPRCGTLPVAEVRDAWLAGVDAPTRTARLAAAAIAEATAAAPFAGRTAGLVVGTCVGGMPETEDALAAAGGAAGPDPALWHRHGCAFTTAWLADRFGCAGPAITISTACSSGAQAIAAAADLLRAGEVDVAIAGGVDAICRLTLNGFASLLAVDPEGCRPFDRARAGMSLGEGAAFVVLERAADAGRRTICELAGAGNTCDAHHATAPDPSGGGAAAAIVRALGDARLDPRDVDYVNAHGTGTRDNDLAEGRALRAVFGAAVPAVSSVKRVFGHTLGAAGAIEAVVCAAALRDGFMPGTAGLGDVDPECGIEPVRATVHAAVRTVLSSSFGFGGNNTVLCLRATEP